MKRQNVLGFIIGITISSSFALPVWQLPDPQLRYDQVVFLTSHNSYSAKNHGFMYAQQQWSISEQLEHGVRGLMLDTYNPSRFTKEKTVVLCHGGTVVNRILRKGKAPMAFSESLTYVKKFLEKNPQEVVTIFLENYVKNKKFLDKAIYSSGIDKFTLKPADWLMQEHGGWPTLAWMQKENKRLIIFNSIGKTKLTFNEWEHVIENQYGTLNIHRACAERRESIAWRAKKRHLYLVNYIPTFKVNFGQSYAKVNSTKLKLMLKQLYRDGLGKDKICKNQHPNFINIDFVNEGKALHYVNKINKAAQVALAVSKAEKDAQK